MEKNKNISLLVDYINSLLEKYNLKFESATDLSDQENPFILKEIKNDKETS